MRLVLLSIALLLSCGRGGTEEPDPVNPFETNPIPPLPTAQPLPPQTNLTCPKGTPLAYDNFGAAFFARYCLFCHTSAKSELARNGAPADINFDSAHDIQIWRAQILSKTIGTGASMPPSGAVSSTEQAALSEWLNCGAPKASKN